MAEGLRIYRRSELEAIKPSTDSEGCLYRYDKIWNQGFDDTSDPALVGIAFHAINHAYVLKLLDAKLGQDEGLSHEAFVEGIAASQCPSRLVPDVRSVWSWHAESFELPLERFVAAEERGQSGDTGFTPDLVLAHPERNSLEVLDFKSGWHPPLTEAELKGLFQARFYSRYAQERWPHFSSYEFTLVAVRFRKSVTVSYTPAELDQVELEVRAAIATIQEANKTGVWPATAGPSCRFCTLACPIADQTITLPKRLTEQQAVQLGGWLLVAEKQLKAAKKLLKVASSAYGPITVNGVVFADRPTVSRAYPIGPLLDVLNMRGIMGAFEADQGYSISHSALSKLFKAHPMLEDDLKSVVQSKTSYRFSAKQPVNPDAPALGDGDEE